MKWIMAIVAAFVVLSFDTASAQGAGGVRPVGGLTSASLVTFSRTPARVAPPSGRNFYASDLTKVKNRARTFGANPSASGTRYFAVTDADLLGKTGGDVVTRLSPTPVKAGDGVRRMDVVVDIHRPLTIGLRAGEAAIGTVFVESEHLQQIDVRASIYASSVMVIRK